MINFKGIRMYYFIATIMLVFQMFNVIGFLNSMEAATFLSVFLMIGVTIKLVVFDKKFRETKYWLLIIFLFVQVVIIGLDTIVPIDIYNIAVSTMLLAGLAVLICFDAPSIRKQMDDDAYVLKNACSALTLTYAIVTIEILMDYMYPPHVSI